MALGTAGVAEQFGADLQALAMIEDGAPRAACVAQWRVIRRSTSLPRAPQVCPKPQSSATARWLMAGDMQVLWEITKVDCFYCFLPLYHGAASMSLTATAMAGARIVVRRKFSRSEFWSDIRAYDITFCRVRGRDLPLSAQRSCCR